MNVNVIIITNQWLVVEYRDDAGPQRKRVPRGLHNTSMKGPTTISEAILRRCPEYSNVDLTELEIKLSPVQVRLLTFALRDAGLWLQEDYRVGYRTVAAVLRQRPEMIIDTQTVINAAMLRRR